MRIEDCEVGMEVRNKAGRTFEISKIKDGEIKFVGYVPYFPPDNYEPLDNKFEVGDEVRVKGVKKLGKILFVVDEEDGYNQKYLVETYDIANNKKLYQILKERFLSPIKNKDELEKGDKFKAIHEEEFEVVAVGDYEDTNEKTYFAKTFVDGEKLYYAISSESIEEIIYN
jgi:hypothetical protein